MSAQLFELSDEEKQSLIWRKLSAYLQREIDNARKLNDNIQSEAETNLLRGKIRALRGLLNLGGTPPPVD